MDRLLEVLSEDKSVRRKHKVAYGEVKVQLNPSVLVQYLSNCCCFFSLLPVSGMGFGIISAVVSFANVLQSSGGPGIVGVVNRGSQYFVLTSGTYLKEISYYFIINFIIYYKISL